MLEPGCRFRFKAIIRGSNNVLLVRALRHTKEYTERNDIIHSVRARHRSPYNSRVDSLEFPKPIWTVEKRKPRREFLRLLGEDYN